MSTKKKRGARSASRYAPEFQRDAVTMVLDEKRPIPDVARAPEATTGTCPTDGPPDLGEVAFTQLSGKARVGHDRVEVVHQIGLRHHRQIDDVTIRQ